MYKTVFFLLCVPFFLFAIDSDFDGVDDSVDACLDTPMLDIVTADGCSASQKKPDKEKSLGVSLLQSYSFFDVPNDENIQNYNLALLMVYDDWLVYLGSGYFKYNNNFNNIEDFTDTTLLLQKLFKLSSSHYLKSSLSTTFPTYNTDGNNIDYGANVSYWYIHKNFDVELGYQYDLINDTNGEDIKTGYLYIGHEITKSLRGTVGYSQDSQERKNRSASLLYYFSEDVSLSYTFTDAKNNFYERLHSFGLGYQF